MPPNESSNNQSTGATSPTNQPSAETEELIKEGIHGIRQIFKKNGEDLGNEQEVAIVRNDPPPPWPELPWFALYCSICKDLIDFTLIELTGVGYVVVLILGWILWVFLFFWFLGKMNGTWWRSLLIKRFWIWMVGVFVLESIPFLKIIPANTILVLMAHYREKKMVKLIMLAMDLWHKYEIPLREAGELPPLSGATAHTDTNRRSSQNKQKTKRAPRDGSTPKTPEENPVIASQQEHFADPSTPVARGATAAPRAVRSATPIRRVNPQDEEVATGLRNQEGATPFAHDPYREDTYALESTPPRGIDALPRQQNNTTGPHVPFPGISPQFGRGTRQGEPKSQSPRTHRAYETGPDQRREAVRKTSQEARGAALRDILSWETVSNGANLIPFAGGGKMLVEAITGKEAYGAEFATGKARIIHAGIGVASLALDFTGIGEAGKATIVVGKSVGLVEKIGVKLTQKGAAKSARVFSKTAKFMAEHPELTKKGEEYAEAKAQNALKGIKKYREGVRSKPEQNGTMPS